MTIDRGTELDHLRVDEIGLLVLSHIGVQLGNTFHGVSNLGMIIAIGLSVSTEGLLHLPRGFLGMALASLDLGHMHTHLADGRMFIAHKGFSHVHRLTEGSQRLVYLSLLQLNAGNADLAIDRARVVITKLGAVDGQSLFVQAKGTIVVRCLVSVVVTGRNEGVSDVKIVPTERLDSRTQFQHMLALIIGHTSLLEHVLDLLERDGVQLPVPAHGGGH
mmetsp:Transcript_16187/g.46503  ORF Transcript_16187/g.46503 Transcript_16187/m.46503 type:complete len:218 (+) Transcript_16187:1187-1840(+)